jgi:hypothetical protein
MFPLQMYIDAPACWLTGAYSQEAPALRLELANPARLSLVVPLLNRQMLDNQQ